MIIILYHYLRLRLPDDRFCSQCSNEVLNVFLVSLCLLFASPKLSAFILRPRTSINTVVWIYFGTCIYKSRFNYIVCVLLLYFGIIDLQIAPLNMLCNICQCFECWNGAFDALCLKVLCYLLFFSITNQWNVYQCGKLRWHRIQYVWDNLFNFKVLSSFIYSVTSGIVRYKFHLVTWKFSWLSACALWPNTKTKCSYIHHGLVAHWNELSSCECKLLVGCGDDEEQTALERDRSSHPVAAPGRVSHTFSLK
jgi:hypothetical protein